MDQSGNKGKNLVFIHGSGNNGAVWAYQSRFFSQRHKIFAVDLPGHGHSKESSRTTVEGYADYISGFVKEKSIASPILIGHSLGGAIALRLALDQPFKIGGLVLVGTGARLRVLPTFFQLLKTDFDSALRLITEYAFSPKTPTKIVDKAMQQMKKGGADILYNDFTASDGFDIMEEVSHISVPTLILVGRDDRLTPVKYSEYLNKHIAGSRLEIIEGAGHMVMFEQPHAFNAALDRFLNALD